MKIGHSTLAGICAIAAALSSACDAQSAATAPGESAPGITAPGSAECAKPLNKDLPGCNGDKGINLLPPPAIDPAIKRTPPPTGDPIANPQSGATGGNKLTPR
jgi:hypothetical protein